MARQRHKTNSQKYQKSRGEAVARSEGKGIVRGAAINQLQTASWDRKQQLMNEMKTSMTGIGPDAAPVESTIIKADNPHTQGLLKNEMQAMYNNYVRGDAEGRAGWSPNEVLGSARS